MCKCFIYFYNFIENYENHKTNEYSAQEAYWIPRTHAFTDMRPMGGAQGSNIVVRSLDGTNHLIGRSCLPTNRRCHRANRTGASCSWLGRRSTGAYAGTLQTPTLLKRAKPRVPPTFSSLPFPPTFYLVYRTQRQILCAAKLRDSLKLENIILSYLFCNSCRLVCFIVCEILREAYFSSVLIFLSIQINMRIFNNHR